jgi:hypothetical protein
MQNGEFGKRTVYPQPTEPIADGRSGRRPMGIIVALAFAIALGLMVWGFSESNRVASNTASGATTGSSTSTPSPSNPPPTKGAGESNSTR